MTLFSKFTKSGGNNDKSIYPWSQRKLSGSHHALPRFGHSAAALDNQHILVYGGIHKGNTKKNMFVIDTNSISASSLATSGDVPSLRSFTTISSIGSFVLLYGGEPIHGSEIWDPYFYVLHTNTRQWSRVRTKGRLPSERAGHSTCVSDDGIMYIFGGHFQRKYLNDLCAFNVKEYPAKAEWQFIRVENQGPTPRSGHISVIYDKKLYIFGGINASHLYNDIWYFDLVTHVWHQISAVGYIPAPRESCAAALVDDTIYIFGGRGLNGCGLGDLCAFRIKSQRWYMFQSMGAPPSPRYGLSMTVIHNKIYVFGGDSVTGKTDDSAYVYTLDCSKIKYPPEPEASESENSNVDRAQTSTMRHDSPNTPKSQIQPANMEQQVNMLQLQCDTKHMDHQILDEPDQKINPPVAANSLEGNLSTSRQLFTADPHYASPPTSPTSPPPRPPREGISLNEAYRQTLPTVHDSYKFKRESSVPPRSQIPSKPYIPALGQSTITAMDPDEKAKLLLEIKARDAIISEMKKKEQWWRTEVSVARQLRTNQGHTLDNGENDTNDDDEKDMALLNLEQHDKLMLFQQLVTVKAEIRKVRHSINKQNDPILEKIEQVENIRAIALEEAAYFKAKYTALKSRNKGVLDLLESDRVDTLEKRLLYAYEEKDTIERSLQKMSSQSKHDQSARLLAEDRARDAQKQSEEAQEAHQNALEELTLLYEQIIKLEAQGRDDAIQIANLSSKLADQLSLKSNTHQDSSQWHMESGRLEAANIKLRNEIAVLLKRLEESKDDENNLKMLLNEKDQAYAEALLELEKTCIELDLLKGMSNGNNNSGSQNALTTVQ
ncbi:conserved hypothetical protein [Mucor ambiguus]|uniref:Galactose oxidase n=1 Tax=Mucor ambiguus TaxID=91626 RepID=A0A0C9MU57_9FUNG|nr:conserved hypothetical protein [Mucor ambiguus]